MNKTIFASAATALALTLVGGFASAASLSDWDHNSDGYVSTDEFYSGVADQGYYSNWDTNNDGLLEEDEFNELGFDNVDYGDWDTNGDSYLDSGEVYDGVYGYYDENDDGQWDDSDWDDANESGIFDM